MRTKCMSTDTLGFLKTIFRSQETLKSKSMNLFSTTHTYTSSYYYTKVIKLIFFVSLINKILPKRNSASSLNIRII